MSGRTILKTIWRMKWLVIVTVLVFLGTSAGVTMLLPDTYQATATIRVVPFDQNPNTDQPVSPYSQVQSSQALARTYTELFKSPASFETAVEQSGLSASAGALRGRTKVSYVEATDLIQVQVTASSPLQASSTANTLANAFVQEKGTDSNEQLVVADPAVPPEGNKDPSFRTNLTLALLLGAAVGVAGAVLLSLFRGYVSSPEEVEELVGAPILGSLPRTRKGQDPRKSPAFVEAASNLRANLDFALDSSDDDSSRKAILVSSTLPKEGKTVLSCALAESYARVGRESLVVDGVIREPRVHEYFSVHNERGLSNVLAEGSEPPNEESLPMIEEAPNLTVLTGGKVPPHPVDLLSSDAAQRLVHDLRERFDVVILDSPAAFLLADASVLGSQTDGIVLVVDLKRARRRDLLNAVHQLRGGKGRILGVALNREKK